MRNKRISFSFSFSFSPNPFSLKKQDQLSWAYRKRDDTKLLVSLIKGLCL
jgi:hypothetical protein